MARMYGCFKGRTSESTSMASGPPGVMANQEPAEVMEECSGKKKSKFQTFKNFFARKKRKEPPTSGGEAGLKGSQSSDNVNKTPENTLTRSEKGSGSKVSLGSKALSHDSVFVSDSSEANETLGASQDSIHGKVKSLQLQLKQGIRLGSPPSLMCVRRTEDAGTMSEDDGLPCSPPEYSTLHTVLNQAQRSSASLEGTDTDEDQMSCAASSRAVSPLVAVPGDFSQPASPLGCLDNSAAKHKMGLRHKACTKRKPASKLDLSTEGDSLVEDRLSSSIPEACEESEETGEVSSDQLTAEEEEGRDEADRHSKHSLWRDKEEEEQEMGEEELEAGHDVSHAPVTSCVSEESSSRASPGRATPEPPAGQTEHLLDPSGNTYGMQENGVERDFALGAAEEEEEDGVLLSSIGGEDEEEESSFLQEVLSSLKTPLTSHSLGPDTCHSQSPDTCHSDTCHSQSPDTCHSQSPDTCHSQSPDTCHSLSPDTCHSQSPDTCHSQSPDTCHSDTCHSLGPDTCHSQGPDTCHSLGPDTCHSQGPDTCHSQSPDTCHSQGPDTCHSQGLDTDSVVLNMKRGEWGAKESESDTGEEETKEEEEEEGEPVSHQAPPSGFLPPLFGRPTQEEEVGGACQAEEEEENVEEEDKEEVDEVVEQFRQHDQEEEGEKDEAPECCAKEGENDLPVRQGAKPEEEEGGGESEGEEAARELEKVELEEVELEEVEREEVEEDSDVGEVTVLEVGTDVPEQDEGLHVLGEGRVFTPECDPTFTTASEGPAASRQSTADETGEGEARSMEGLEIDQKSDREEDFEGNQPNALQEDGDQEAMEIAQVDEEPAGIEMANPDVKHPEEDQRDVEQQDQTVSEQAAISFRPSSLSLPESTGFSETQTHDNSDTSVPTTPSATTTLHINLVSPRSEKAMSPLRQSLGEDVNESSSPAAVTTEQDTKMHSPTDEADAMEEEAKSAEAFSPPSSGSDLSKVRFTIAPAWQRTLSAGGESPKEPVAPAFPFFPVSSPTPSGGVEAEVAPSGGVEAEVQAKKEPKAEPMSSVKAEVVLSPGRPRSAGNITAKAQTSPTATGEESRVLLEGKPESPFGVRLRKTLVLHRYGSEEENTEPAPELPAQPTGSKVDPPQPISVKHSIGQPISNKPILPRKPELQGDSGVKTKRTPPEPAAGSDAPCWISVARQKQRIYKDNSLDDTTAKEDSERKASLPLYVSSAASRGHCRTPKSTGKVSPLELTKPAAPVEKEPRRAFSPPTPVPAQPPKLQSPTCPAPKPSPQRALSCPPTPVPVAQRPPSCAGPPSLSKVPPPSSEMPPSSSSAPPIQRPPAQLSQRGSLPTPGSPSPSSPQDEPPWMALAKKKAKAWSEMPQIVQ